MEIYLLMCLNDIVGTYYYTDKEEVEKMADRYNNEFDGGGDFWCATLTMNEDSVTRYNE